MGQRSACPPPLNPDPRHHVHRVPVGPQRRVSVSSLSYHVGSMFFVPTSSENWKVGNIPNTINFVPDLSNTNGPSIKYQTGKQKTNYTRNSDHLINTDSQFS